MMYTIVYVNQKNIKNKPQLIAGSEEHLSAKAMLAMVLICQQTRPCSVMDSIENFCTATLSENFQSKLRTVLEVTPRTLHRILNELISANMLYLVDKKKQHYYVNPFVMVNNGNAELIKAARIHFAERGIFYPLEVDENIRFASHSESEKLKKLLNVSPDKQSHFSLFLDIDSMIKYRCFLLGEVNFTELMVFFILAGMASFVKSPHVPDACGKVILDGNEKKRLAKTLKISESTLNRVTAKLCDYHLLHKISGVNGQYIINPYIAARGAFDKVVTLRNAVICDYFSGFGDGDTIIKADPINSNVAVVDKVTGELLRMYCEDNSENKKNTTSPVKTTKKA